MIILIFLTLLLILIGFICLRIGRAKENKVLRIVGLIATLLAGAQILLFVLVSVLAS